MSSKLFRGLAVALLVCVALIGLLEVAARLFYVPVKPPAVRKYVAADPSLPELTTFADLDRHNQRGLYRGFLYETNRLRLRSPERAAEKPPGVTRIALLGDSYVMGDGVLAEDTYAWRLEEELPRRRPGRYETINTGLSGLNAVQAVMRYAELGLPYHPDIAVYGFTINDLEGPHYKKTSVARPDPYGVEGSPLLLWRIVGPGYVAFRERFFPQSDSYIAELRQNFFGNAAVWKDFTAALDQLAEVDRSRGICSVFFVHTYLVTLNVLHPFVVFYDRAADAARERGFLVIESLPVFRGRSDKALWVNPFDSHPNPEGHRLLAEALADGLTALPPECWHSNNSAIPR